MRQRNPHVFRAVPFLLAVTCAAPVLAQATPAAKPTPGRTTRKTADTPIEEFDLEAAIVSDTGGLTADQVAQKSVARSPQIQASEANATASRYDAESAWVNFLPILTVGAQYKRISEVINNFGQSDPDALNDFLASVAQVTDPTTQQAFVDLGRVIGAQTSANFTQPLNNYALTAKLQVPVSDILLRVLPSYEGAKGYAEAQKLNAQATAEGVELQAREYFYAYAAVVARHALLQQAMKQAEAVATQTKLFVDAGTKAPVELMVATATLEQTRGEFARAEGDLAYARAAIATVMGVGIEQVQGISEPVTQLPEGPTASGDELTRRALEQRTELLALRKAVGASQKLQNSEKNAAWPQLVLEGNTLYANPNPRYVPPVAEFNNTWDVSVNVQWTPNQWLTARAKGARAEATTAKARADLLAMEDAVRVEVVQSHENFKSAVASAKAAEAGVAAAEEAYRVRLATYKVGAGVLIDLTDAHKKLNDARLLFVQSAIQARLALAQLKRRAALD